MTDLMKEHQGLEPDWRTRLEAHPLHQRVFIACIVASVLLILVFLQVGLLIAGVAILSGTVVAAVFRAGVAGREQSPARK